MTGEFKKAAFNYKMAIDLKHGGSILPLFYFIDEYRSGGETGASAYLNRLAPGLEAGSQFADIARFCVGLAGEERILAAADPDPARDKQLKCVAYYFAGMAYLLGLDGATKPDGPDTAGAGRCFENCLATRA